MSGSSSNCASGPVDAFAPPRAAQPIGARKEIEILDDRQIAIERKLLGDITEPLASRRTRGMEIDASHAQRAMGWREQAAEHAEGGRFACPVRPEQTEHLAAPNLETYMIHCGEGAKLPNQIIDLDDQPVSPPLRAGCSSVIAAAGRSGVAWRKRSIKPSSNRACSRRHRGASRGSRRPVRRP